jgi:hypothetical protein
MRLDGEKNRKPLYKMSARISNISEFPEITGTAIQPATITDVKNVTHFEVRVMGLELFTSVSVFVTLKDADGSISGTRSFTFSGQDYLNWNNDDSYLVSLVASRLGFTLA